jgi:hypothetical protein
MRREISERYVKGPLISVNVDGTEYRLRYRRRYYPSAFDYVPAVHFTWVEIEVSPGRWEEADPCFQSAPPEFNFLKAKNIRHEVTEFIRRFKPA